jgi:hypothetical protein
MKCLFIGGPKAGMLIDVDPRVNRVEFPVHPPVQWVSEHEELPNLSYGKIAYKLDFAKDGNGNRHAMYVLGGSGDPLIQLMEFYAQANHKTA